MIKRKAFKKGGFNNPIKAGPTLPETLYNRDKQSIESLKNTYQMNLDQAKKDMDRQQNIKDAATTTYMKQKKIEANEDKLNTTKSKLLWKQIVDSGKGFMYLLSGLLQIIKYIITFIITNTKFAIKTISTAGQGAIIKAIFAILFIVLVILGATGTLYKLSGYNSKISESNDISGAMLSQNDENYLAMPKTNNIFSQMYDYIDNLVPFEYKYKMASISNSVTYLASGKNQYDAYLEPREEITTGRSDNIFHVNFNNSSDMSNEKTYSIITPKDVLLNFNENLYYNSDYNKIDGNIRNYIKYPNKSIIPITSNTNGKYILDLSSNVLKYYYNDTIKDNSSYLIKPIFVYSDDTKMKVNFNSFNNYLYTGYFDVNNNIASYAAKLINPNYKGPILRLTNADRDEINTANENKKGKLTANFYNDYNTRELYTIIDNKKIYYNDYFIKQQSYVAIIYDQSGNNNHLKYEKYDSAYMPELKIDNSKNYAVFFHDQHMLFFIKQISYKKIKIHTKILFNAISDITKINDMIFLATKTDPVIDIKGNANNFLVFHTTKNTENIENTIKQISDNLPIVEINKRWTSSTTPFDITTKYIYNENKDPIILECLGNNLTETSLKGYLYELRIFKSDD